MYAVEPQNVSLSSSSCISLAKPKSAIFSEPSIAISRFSHFISLCTFSESEYFYNFRDFKEIFDPSYSMSMHSVESIAEVVEQSS